MKWRQRVHRAIDRHIDTATTVPTACLWVGASFGWGIVRIAAAILAGITLGEILLWLLLVSAITH